MKVLFKDLALPQTIPFSRFRTIFSFRDGIYTPIERALKSYDEDCALYFSHPDKEYEEFAAMVDGLIPAKGNTNESDYDIVITSETVDTLTIMDRVKENITHDLELRNKNNFLTGEDLMERYPKLRIIGDAYDLYIHKDVTITSDMIILDARDGIIVIDKGATISPFTTISGTTYIGKGTEVADARISHNTIIGNNCRVSGEVNNSIFNDYSYKSHEGFVGRSILGSWVNLGAMTTTSNLKNNYSIISLTLPESNSIRSELIKLSTNTIKFGSLIGDYTKTAIGVMINCGTVIDSGSNVMIDRPSNYIPPLRWLDYESQYDSERFISDTKTILGRKGVELPRGFKQLVKQLS